MRAQSNPTGRLKRSPRQLGQNERPCDTTCDSPRSPFAGILAAACGSAAPAPSDADFTARVNAFVNEWHDDAAHARPAFFDKIASDGIYIGTDKTERWTREAFREWAKPAFARPVAWAFTPLHRNVQFSPDRRFIWFDEQVRSSMGILQASGVMRPATDEF